MLFWRCIIIASCITAAFAPRALCAQEVAAPEGSGLPAPSEGSGFILEEEIAPSLEEEIVPSLEEEMAPVLEEEIAPSLEEEIAPVLEEEIAPSLEEEIAPALEEEIAPPLEEEAPLPVSKDKEDAYYEQFWDELDKSEPAVAPPPMEVPTGKVRLSGTVIDREFGTPLEGVGVALDGRPETTRTGTDGAFFFDVEPGVFVVRLQLFSYAT